MPLKLFIAIILVFTILPAYAQKNELKDLKQKLENTGDSLAAMKLMNKIGFLIHMKSADSSFYYGVKAYKIALRFKDKEGEADALTNMAISMTLKGLYSQSLTYYTKAYDTYSLIPDSVKMAQQLMNSAITYSFIGDSVKSKEFSSSAMTTARHFIADSAYSMLLVNDVEMNALTGSAAIAQLNKAQKIAAHYHDDRTLLFIMQERATFLLDSKDIKSALPLILESIRIAKLHRWDYHEMEGLSVYADYFIAVKKPDSALAKYQKIYKMAVGNGYVFDQVEVLKSIQKIYGQKGDLKKELETSTLLVKALEKEKANSNSFLGDYFKYNAAQQDLKSLQIKSLDDSKKQYWLISISVLGFLTTLFIVIIYIRSVNASRQLTRLNRQITSQNDVLKSNDEFKGKLLTMLAHDFRSPLSNTLGLVSLLKEDELDEAVLVKSYNTIERDIHNVLATFDSILIWVKKQMPGYSFVPEKLNFSQLCAQVMVFFKEEIDVKEIVINNLANPHFAITSDKEILQFVNRNLIQNAIKYSPQNGIIKINVKTGAGEVVVSIKNEGAGMTPDQLKELFKFKPSDMDQRNAGMALTICRDFMTLLGGRIWAESEPGFGATFFYALPVGK